MKIVKLSLVAAMTAGLCSVASANSLSEALKAGKVSGEVTATYESRDFNKADTTYYQDTGYSVGSFALKYESGVWNNLSLTSKFRAYATLFEDDSDSTTSHGVKAGDSSERFYQDGDNKDLDAEELFITYAPSKNVTIKAGRQFISSHWVNKTNDAVRINAAFGNTSVEAIWALRHGRIYSRDYRPMTKTNENKGIFQVALTQKFNDMLSASVYSRMDSYENKSDLSKSSSDIYGMKVNGKLASVSLGAHYAKSSHNSLSTLDSNLMHLTAKTTVAGFTPYIGYIKVDDDAAFPGWTSSGETIDPFEEGDHIYKQGAETLYVGVSKSFGDLSATLLYGETEYGTDKREMDETTLWLGYKVNEELKANLGYTIVNEDKAETQGDMNQLNLTLTYSF